MAKAKGMRRLEATSALCTRGLSQGRDEPRQHGAGIHTKLLKAGEIGGVRALTYFTVCLADSRHRYELQAVRRSWLQAADH